jgi:hypothetical protein
MKKLILFIAFALLFTIFSCTPDEYETTSKKIEKVGKPSASDPGPGDDKTGPPPPPAP